MISDQSKDKLIVSFDSLVMAVHNMKACIALEGKRAFADGDTQDISELLVIMTKLNEVASKVNKLAPTFRSYRLDIATKNHSPDLSVETDINSKIKIVKCYIPLSSDKDAQKINCIAEISNTGEVKFTLKAPQEFLVNSSLYSSDTKKRFLRAVSSDDISILNWSESKDNVDIIINRDMQFKSANSLCSFVLSRKVQDGLEIIKAADNDDPISTLVTVK